MCLNHKRQTYGFGEGAGEVVGGEGVLGQKVLDDDVRHIDDHLLVLGQRFLAH